MPVAGVKNLRELVECLKNPEPYLKREIQEEIPSIINTDMGMDFQTLKDRKGQKSGGNCSKRISQSSPYRTSGNGQNHACQKTADDHAWAWL